MNVIPHIRGDTFYYIGRLPDALDLSGASVKSQIRTNRGKHIDDLDVELSPDKTIKLRKQITKDWPIGMAELDVQFTLPGGDIISTGIVHVIVQKDVTL